MANILMRRWAAAGQRTKNTKPLFFQKKSPRDNLLSIEDWVEETQSPIFLKQPLETRLLGDTYVTDREALHHLCWEKKRKKECLGQETNELLGLGGSHFRQGIRSPFNSKRA